MTAPAKGKGWSYSTGERGVNRVRAFAHVTTGRLFLEYYEPRSTGAKPRPQRVALGHRDQARAKMAADELAAKLRAAGSGRPAGPVTLATLFDIYEREVTPTKAPQTRAHDRECMAMFLRAFGDRPAAQLSRREWDRFIRDRRSGALRPASRSQRQPVVGVRDRAIAYDLGLLTAVLNWATVSSDGRGGVLLERNPLQGLPRPREDSPRRPVLSAPQYEQLRRVAGDVHPLFDLALVLARETGHRISAIRQLRWSDVDLVARQARWRGENDKIGFDHKTPLSVDAVRALEAVRQRHRAIGDAWIFADVDRAGVLILRDRFNYWWRRGVELAELALDERCGWHSLRRQFANRLRDIPLKDLCGLGGWKDANTILTCYQQPDQNVMRDALDRQSTGTMEAAK